MEELIAAAGTSCAIDLQATALDGQGLQTNFAARIADGSATPASTLMIDFGAQGARAVDVELVTESGVIRRTRIERGDRLRATGRFYLDLGAFWMPDLADLRVRFDRPLAPAPETPPGIFLCRTQEGATP